MKVDGHFPLRGFVICPDCGRMLTGSKSKGRSQYYYYYHCSGGCKFRHKAEDMNEKIVSEIGKYVYSIPRLNLFKEVITSVYKSKTRDRIGNIQQLKIRLQDENNKLSKARELLLCGDIEADDYRMMKADADKKINRLEAKLTSTITDTQNVEPLWDKAISNLSQLGYLYETGTITQKRKIIGSVFPENLTFDGFKYRTTRVNVAIKYITLIDKDLNGNKKGTNSSFLNLSHQVTPMVQNSNQLIEDLKLLADILAA
nr:zinc ribbon domain-containing protein [Zunongwangia pacifica]